MSSSKKPSPNYHKGIFEIFREQKRERLFEGYMDNIKDRLKRLEESIGLRGEKEIILYSRDGDIDTQIAEQEKKYAGYKLKIIFINYGGKPTLTPPTAD